MLTFQNVKNKNKALIFKKTKNQILPTSEMISKSPVDLCRVYYLVDERKINNKDRENFKNRI